MSRWIATRSAPVCGSFTPRDVLRLCRWRQSPASQWLSLIFVATENYFNGAVRVDGAPTKTNPKAHQLVESSKLDLGARFARSVDRSVERMQKVMADNGYYKAAITYDLPPHDDTRQMDINFHVVPGELARVGEVTIEGDTGIPPDKVRSLTKLKSGDKVKQEHVTRAL